METTSFRFTAKLLFPSIDENFARWLRGSRMIQILRLLLIDKNLQNYAIAHPRSNLSIVSLRLCIFSRPIISFFSFFFFYLSNSNRAGARMRTIPFLSIQTFFSFGRRKKKRERKKKCCEIIIATMIFLDRRIVTWIDTWQENKWIAIRKAVM